MSGGPFNVVKNGMIIPVSREMLYPPRLSEEERERRIAEWRARRGAANASWPQFVRAVAAIADPLARAVLDLHRISEEGDCSGCEFDGYEAEPVAWPCSTTLLIAERMGVEVPPDMDMVEQTVRRAAVDPVTDNG